MGPIPLVDLEAFAAVARHRSFRLAAAERNVSSSLLSQTIRRLEERLGVRLLNRTTRSVMPTKAGEALLAGLSPAFENIAQAVESLNGFRERPAGHLRITAPKPVAVFLIAPRIPAFQKMNPEVSIEISADDTLIDIVADNFDAGVRFGDNLAQSMVAVAICEPVRMAIVGSPQYLQRHGTPTTIEDLSHHDLTRTRFPNGTICPWELCRGDAQVRIEPDGPLTFNDPAVQLEAVKNGAGLAYVFERFAKADVEAGNLMYLLTDWLPYIGSPYLYYPSRRHVPASLRAFIEHMRYRPE